MKTNKNQKRNRKNKKKQNNSIWLIILAVIITVAVVIVLKASVGKSSISQAESSASEITETAAVSSESAEDTAAAPNEQTASDESAAESSAAETAPTEELSDAPYEHWLAAAAVTAVSMNYMDFEPVSFYIAGDTSLAEKSSSRGVCFIFDSEGVTYTAYAYPIEELRTEAGTTDISTPVIENAGLDIMEGWYIPEDFYETAMDDLNTLIEQSSQVYFYTN